MARHRLGVALLLPSPVAEEVNGLRRALGDRSLDRVPPHITLVPPVNVRADDLGRALALLRGAAAAAPRQVTVTLDGPASFLPANAVLYLPVDGDVGAVHALRDRLWEAPLTRTLTWPFVPHVTLADGADPGRIEAAVASLAGYRATVTFDRLHLLVERRPGPRWQPLADAAFGPPSVVARGGPLAVELVRSSVIDPEGAALLAAEGTDLGIAESPEPGPGAGLGLGPGPGPGPKLGAGPGLGLRPGPGAGLGGAGAGGHHGPSGGRGGWGGRRVAGARRLAHRGVRGDTPPGSGDRPAVAGRP